MIRSGIVYADSGMFAGWPANHGAWQWGSEWLVGFLRGRYARSSMHNIREPFEYCFARSLDDGLTWTVEPHGREFEAGVVTHSTPLFSMPQTIRRVCGVYDHGGDECDPRGGFFLSYDRGRTWRGPFLFEGLEDQFNGKELHCTARQAELPDDDLLFLTNAERFSWGTDQIFVARYVAGRFTLLSRIDFGEGRAVCPAVARIGGRIVVAARRRKNGTRSGWIDVCHSDDGGATWSKPRFVTSTGSNNGNPPALINADGALCCAYGDRDARTICARWSDDLGATWGEPQVLATSPVDRDLGYPRLLRRQDGVVIAIYYIATQEHPQQHIAWSEVPR